MTAARREAMFAEFYAMDSKTEQDLHLQRLIKKNDVKRHRPREETSPRSMRQNTFSYYVLNEKCMEVEVSVYDWENTDCNSESGNNMKIRFVISLGMSSCFYEPSWYYKETR